MGMLLFAARFALVLCAFLVGFALVLMRWLMPPHSIAVAACSIAKPAWLVAFGGLWVVPFPPVWHVPSPLCSGIGPVRFIVWWGREDRLLGSV